MRLKIAVCDDEQNQLESMADIVSAWAVQHGHTAEVQKYPSAEAFWFAYDSDNTVDILLLDIEMKQMNGVELAKKIRRTNKRMEIIFISSHFEFYGEGYEVDALHFLVKPVQRGKVCEVLDKAADRLAVEAPSVIISCEGETVRLGQDEIMYVESFLHYIMIHTKKREYKVKESISAFEEQLSEGFFRIHRSYIVSLGCVTRITRTEVTLDDTVKLPLARGKYDSMNRAYIEFYR